MYIKAWRNKRNFAGNTKPSCDRRREGPCFGVWAAVCNPLSKAECVPTFTHESERELFVLEVLKPVWPMHWKRWYDCVSCTFRRLFGDEKESRIKDWRRNRRSAQSLLPAVRAVDGGFNAVGCGAFCERFQSGWRLSSCKRRCPKEFSGALWPFRKEIEVITSLKTGSARRAYFAPL